VAEGGRVSGTNRRTGLAASAAARCTATPPLRWPRSRRPACDELHYGMAMVGDQRLRLQDEPQEGEGGGRWPDARGERRSASGWSDEWELVMWEGAEATWQPNVVTAGALCVVCK